MATLDRLYRALLLAYPEDYRRARGDEMLGTLLEVAGTGRRLPEPREAGALILGGLRARARVGPDGGAPGVWAASVRLGAALLVAMSAPQQQVAEFAIRSRDVFGIVFAPAAGTTPTFLLQSLAALSLVATVLALLRGAGRWGLALVALNALLMVPLDGVEWPARIAALPPLVAAAGVFACVPARRGFRWPWPTAVPLVSLAAAPALLAAVSFHQPLLGFVLPLARSHAAAAVAAAVVVASVTVMPVAAAALLIAASRLTLDPRPALGAALGLAAVVLSTLVSGLGTTRLGPLDSGWGPSGWLAWALPALLAAACFGESRIASRRARQL